MRTIKCKIIYILLFNIFVISFAFSENFKEVSFNSNGVEISGTIVFPKSDQAIASVVFVHGSGRQERNINIAKRFALNGIACLVYDKRGVGKSHGQYEENESVGEKNLNLLADDAVAAINVLNKYLSLEQVPTGIVGISQAGWIIPLAAAKSDIPRFIAIWSGPVCKVSEEDIFSKYTDDKDSDKIPTFATALNAREKPYIWPDRLGKDIDPVESLTKIEIPGFWIYSDNDGSIPVDLSISNIKKLRENGMIKYNYALFSGLGHENISTTFPTLIAWIKREVLGQ